MSSRKKIAIAIVALLIVALIAAALFMFFGKGGNASNTNGNVAVDNANTSEQQYNASNGQSTTPSPGTSTSTTTLPPDSNTSSNGNIPTDGAVTHDLDEVATPPANSNASSNREREKQIYADIANQVQWESDGSYRSVATDPMTDLDPWQLQITGTEFASTLFLENDLAKRQKIMNRLVDIDYVRGNNPSSLNYDWKTNWQYSLVKDDMRIYSGVDFSSVDCVYSGAGSILVLVHYMRGFEGDDGGGWHEYQCDDFYRVKISNDYKVRDIEYVCQQHPPIQTK